MARRRLNQYFYGGGGGLQIDDVAGEVTTVVITGNLDVESGDYISVNIDGSQNGVSDLIQVQGLLTLNNADLNTTTLNASPTSGWAYTFLQALGQETESGWSIASPINSGYSANYSFSSLYSLQVN